MGHRHDAVEALRAYAQSLEETITDGPVLRVGSAYQDDARSVTSDLGAPQLRVLVGLMGVVLVGLVGTGVLAANLSPRSDDASAVMPATPAATQVVLPEPATNIAIRALAQIGSTEGLAAVTYAMATDTDHDPAVSVIIATIADLSSSIADGAPDLAWIELEQAIDQLIAIVRPPGLDPDWTPPGLGGVAPGQDDTFIPPGQDDTFIPPGQDDTFIPPGQDDKTPPGQDDTFTPPGQDDKTPPGQDDKNPPGQDKDPGTGNGRNR